MNWQTLYPLPPARRAQLATAVVTVATIALSMTIPERVGMNSTAAAAVPPNLRDALAKEALMLPPELQQQLAALLAALESGDQTTAAALAGNQDLREMLEKLNQLNDTQLLEALARTMAEEAGAENRSAAEDMQSLAERARRAAESATLSREMQEALDKLADELEIAKPEEGARGEQSGQTAGGQPQGESGEAGENGAQDVAIQFARESDTSGGASVMMMSEDAQPGAGPPGAGAGGAGAPDTAGATAGIEAALKQEMVEASQDTTGSNVETEVRHKTEHGNATVAFTGGAAGTFDRARAAAPPAVPESRRPGVQTYFVRKPQ
jgi:hypothetical protein